MVPRVYYNEFDKKVAAWIRELIKQQIIPEGDVDERSIEDVVPTELTGYSQCHFFAGIGVWAYALRRAGWSADRNVWTGSCPCQPFSTAGKATGFTDERHLWPAFHHLIRECRPDTVFGEQVASKDGLTWIDLVSADMEGEGYAVGATDTCAAGFGASHIRQRLYWVAHPVGQRSGGRPYGRNAGDTGESIAENQTTRPVPAVGVAYNEGGSGARGMSQSDHGPDESIEGVQNRGCLYPGGLGDSGIQGLQRLPGYADDGCEPGRDSTQQAGSVTPAGGTGGVADNDSAGRVEGQRDGETAGYRDSIATAGGHDRPGGPREINGIWGAVDWLFCRDEKWRPVESGTFPLADGVTERVGLLRGYGNAIVAPQAIVFIEEYMRRIPGPA